MAFLGAFPVSLYKGEPVRRGSGHGGKVGRIVRWGVETAHIGICATREDGTVCSHMAKTAAWLDCSRLAGNDCRFNVKGT